MLDNRQTHGAQSAQDTLLAAFAWWRDAGVDCDFADDPQSWLVRDEPDETAEQKPKARKVAAQTQSALERTLSRGTGATSIGGSRDAYPADLDDFASWWKSEPSLSDAPTSARVAPTGPTGAPCMFMVGEPMANNALLTDSCLDFAMSMARAMGLNWETIYRTSVLPASVPVPDWDDLAANGLAAVTAHHLALAQPERVIVFGRALAPIFEITQQSARAPSKIIVGERPVPILFAPTLGELARTAPRRKTFWTRWLDWTA